jgi:hypothetical protein
VTLTLEPVRVATGADDEEGRLVFAGERLVAVLVRLSEQHEELAGQWFFEAGFGRLDGPLHPSFEGLADAQAWIVQRLIATGQAKAGGGPEPRPGQLPPSRRERGGSGSASP